VSDQGAASADARLVRALGTWALAASILNITVGGGIFRLPAHAAASLGAAAPLAYVVCVFAMGLIVLCFAQAGSRVALTGGPYAYVEVAFGPFVGFLAGILLWLTATFAGSAVAAAFADSVAALVPGLGGAWGPPLVLSSVLVGLAVLNVTGVRQGAWLNTGVTLLKLLPLLLLVTLGLVAVRPENLRIVAAPSAGDVARTASLLIFAFCGIETALMPSGEVQDPARTVPRAIGLAMGGVALLYLSTQLVAQGILGPDLARETAAPLAEAAGRAFGGWGRTLLLVGATVSMFGFLGGMVLSVPRALFAFARDGFFPGVLATVHERFRTPHLAIATQAALFLGLALSSSFERLAILANLAVLLLYATACIAAWELRRRDVRAGGTPFEVPGAGIVPLLACLVIAWLLTSIRLEEWTAVAACLVAAALLFVLARRRRAGPSLEQQ
jgi:amino acid transporter